MGEGVFLSLSAGKKRITGYTGKAGVFKFGGLAAQRFYLTAILKEFTFKFNGESIDQDGAVTIKDGEHISIQVEATRVAFSANGKIKTLAGKPVNFGIVTATSTGKSEVASITGPQGDFKVMGLLPGKYYTLTFSENASIIRTIPEEIKVMIEDEEEVSGLTFYGIYEKKSITIEGTVFFEGEQIDTADTLSATRSLYVSAQKQKVTIELVDASNGQVLTAQ